MKHARLLALCVCLFSLAAFAQAPGTAPTIPPKTASKPAQKPAPKATAVPERQQYGLKLLEIAETDAGGLEGAMRAFALLQVARGYQRSNPKKTLAILESALNSTRELPDDEIGRSQASDLQEAILEEMVNVAPQRVDELLDSVQPRAKTAALESLLSYYERNKQQGRALEIIYRISQDAEVPCRPAIRLMEKMTRLFDTSLASYRDHGPHTRVSAGGGDFADMVTRFWNAFRRKLRDKPSTNYSRMRRKPTRNGNERRLCPLLRPRARCRSALSISIAFSNCCQS